MERGMNVSKIVGLLLLCSTTCFATTWTVDDDGADFPAADFNNIQDAVNASSDGDEILIYPGTYTGSGNQVVYTQSKGIWLHGTDMSSVIIDGENARRGILCVGSTGSSEMIISDLTIQNCLADDGGGLWIIGNPTVTHCYIRSNTATGNGGNVYVESGDPTFNGFCWIQTGTAQNGGNIYCKDGNPTFVSSYIRYATATSRGGGFFGSNISGTFTWCTFDDNHSNDDAGGAFIIGNTGLDTTFTNCTFKNNSADDKGGGVMNQYFYSGTVALYDSCTFENNEAINSGGAIYNDASASEIVDCIFEDNTALGKGGGIYNWNSSPYIDTSEFRGNSAGGSYGGAIHSDNVGPAIGTSQFCENTPINLGGSYTDEGTNCFADSCTDSDNDGTLDDCDGFLHVYNGESIQAVINAASDGDTILVHEGTYYSDGPGDVIIIGGAQPLNLSIIGDVDKKGNLLTILDCEDQGGGIAITRSTTEQDELHFENLVIYNGDASIYPTPVGGGIYISGGSATFANCEITSNIADYGGGVYIQSMGYGIFVNCLFESNSATNYGGAFYQSSGGQNYLGEETNTTFTDCIFEYNEALAGGGAYMYYSSTTFSDCSMSGNTTPTSYGVGLSGYGFSSCEFFGVNSLQGINFDDSASLLYDSTSSTTVNGDWELHTHFCLVNTEFDIDELNIDELLTINGTMTRGGSLSISNSSGTFDSMTEVNIGDEIPLVRVYPDGSDPALDGAFDGTVFPLLPDGIGFELIENTVTGGKELAIKVIADEGTDTTNTDDTLIVYEPVDLLSFDVDGEGGDEIVALFDGVEEGTDGYVKVYSISDDAPGEITTLFTWVGSAPVDLDAGDLNGDGRDDLIIANAGNNSVAVLLSSLNSNSEPIFNKLTVDGIPIGDEVTCVAVIDWDGNANGTNLLDIVVGVDIADETEQDELRVLTDIATNLTGTVQATLVIPKTTLQDLTEDVIDTASCVDGVEQNAAWGFVYGTRYGQAFRASPGKTPSDVTEFFLANLLGNIVTLEIVELGDDGGDGQVDLYLVSDESEKLYLFDGDSKRPSGFGLVINLEVSVQMSDADAIDIDSDGDMDFILTVPTSDPPLLLLRNGGEPEPLLPGGGMGGRTWSAQGMNSANAASQGASGGDLGGRGEPKDWNRYNNTGDPAHDLARTSCTMEQTNVSEPVTIWTVDDDGSADFNNIQAAIDAAASGDSVMVMPGTYTGTGDDVINMSGKNVHLYSKSGSERTHIDGENARRGIVCSSGESADCIIDGFTIENCLSPSDSSGGGMYISLTSPTVLNCVFLNNTEEYGAAIYLYYVGNMIIDNCNFEENVATVKGGGIRCYWSAATITNCSFSHQTGNAVEIHEGDTTSIGNTYFCNNDPTHIEGNYTDIGGNVFEDYCEDCLEDIDGDGQVAVTDLLELIGAWGSCTACPADIDGNGSVDVADILMLIAAWGDCL